MKHRSPLAREAGRGRSSLFLTAALGAALAAAAITSSACSGCRTTPLPKGPTEAGVPTVRLYLISDLAGALEPCGCTKDQLGGLDHVGAWIVSERAKAPASGVVSAGPLFFMDPTLKADHA